MRVLLRQNNHAFAKYMVCMHIYIHVQNNLQFI